MENLEEAQGFSVLTIHTNTEADLDVPLSQRVGSVNDNEGNIPISQNTLDNLARANAERLQQIREEELKEQEVDPDFQPEEEEEEEEVNENKENQGLPSSHSDDSSPKGESKKGGRRSLELDEFQQLLRDVDTYLRYDKKLPEHLENSKDYNARRNFIRTATHSYVLDDSVLKYVNRQRGDDQGEPLFMTRRGGFFQVRKPPLLV